jgi:type IV pilus assembly protein PilM
MWLELISALTYALPRTPNTQPGVPLDPRVLPFTQRQEIHVDLVESEYFADLAQWFTPEISQKYLEGRKYILALEKGQQPPPAATPANPADPAAAGAAAGPATDPAAEETIEGPTKDGWVVEIRGYHYFNGNPQTSGRTHVLNTLLRRLETGVVRLPGDPDEGREPPEFTMKELGIMFPTLILDDRIDLNYKIANPLFMAAADAGGAGGMGAGGMGAGGMAPGGMAPGGMMPGGMMPGMMPGGKGGPGGFGGQGAGKTPAKGGAADKGKGKNEPPPEPESFDAPRYAFTIQFVWQPVPLSKRLQLKREAAEKLRAEREAAIAAGQPVPGVAGDPAAAGAPAANPAAPNPAAANPAAPNPAAANPAAANPAAPNPAANPAAPNPAAPNPAAANPAQP